MMERLVEKDLLVSQETKENRELEVPMVEEEEWVDLVNLAVKDLWDQEAILDHLVLVENLDSKVQRVNQVLQENRGLEEVRVLR